MFKEKKYKNIIIYKMGRSIGKFTLYPVHSFLVNDIIIDTGTPYTEKEFLTAVKKKKISAIINTHYHEDHIGNNSAIQKKHNAKIYAHKDSIPFISTPEKNRLRFYQKFVWKLPDKSNAIPIANNVETDDFNLKVIEAKGHSKGSIYLYEKNKKWLFTGDMFCGIKNIYLRSDENFNEILKSLEMISELEIDTVFCGLKGVIPHGNIVIKRKIVFMKDLQKRTMDLLNKGFSPKKIKRKLLGFEDIMFYISTGHFSKQNLINSIIKR
ncbi:MAG: MBL fold metallo-hydrolase [Desulfobacterales bacterium]|nr:MBL fold metallo-hydrolase [Desulfobacterales bacterium]